MAHNRLPDKLDSNARVEVRVNGVVVGTRRILDFVGADSGSDDGVNDVVTITLAAGEFGDLWSGPIILTPNEDPQNFLVQPTERWQLIASTANGLPSVLEDGDSITVITPRFIETATDGTDTTTVDIHTDQANITTTGTISFSADDTIGFSPALDTLLADTGVVAGTYGTSVKIPRFTVDATGRLSNVTELPVPTPTPDHLVHTILDHYANVGNSTTTETDLYTDTLAANLLANNGDKIEYRAGGTFVNSATATRELKLYFGGTAIFDTGTLTISAAASWDLEALFIRVSSSVVRYTIKLNTEFAALSAYTAVGELTGLTLSNTQVVKITGQAAGVGAASSDIVAKVGTAMFWPAV